MSDLSLVYINALAPVMEEVVLYSSLCYFVTRRLKAQSLKAQHIGEKRLSRRLFGVPWVCDMYLESGFFK